MPKQVNPDIGTCICYQPNCEHTAMIRRTRNPRRGKAHPSLYLACPIHGAVMMEGQDYQDYILEEGEFWSKGEESDLVKPDQDATPSRDRDQVKPDVKGEDWTPDQVKPEQDVKPEPKPDAPKADPLGIDWGDW